MDFSIEGNYAFEAGAYDSSIHPVVNFNELSEYPKQYVVTPNPLGNDPRMVIMDNAELKAMRSIEGKKLYADSIIDYTSPRHPGRKTLYSDTSMALKSGNIIKSGIETFTESIFGKDSSWLFYLLIIIFVVLLSQIVSMYHNNKLLRFIIKQNKLKGD